MTVFSRVAEENNKKSLISCGDVCWKGLDQNNVQLLVYVLSVVI